MNAVISKVIIVAEAGNASVIDVVKAAVGIVGGRGALVIVVAVITTILIIVTTPAVVKAITEVVTALTPIVVRA